MISRRIQAAAAALLYVLAAPSHAVAQVQQVFSTLGAATAATIPSGIDTVTTLGRNTAGDYGGASHIRIGASTAAAWRFRSADGQWWAINNRTLTPEMLGCFSGGSVDCTAAFGALATILSTFAGGYTVNFAPNAEYLIWPVGTTPATLMSLTAVTGATFNFNGAKIYTNNAFAASIGPAVFNIHNSSNLTFNDPSYACTTCSGTIDGLKYGVFFYINETTAPWSNNIHIVNATDIWHSSFLIVVGDGTGAVQEQAHNFSVVNADLQHVFYGLSFQGSGDNVFARGVKCTDCGRIYFPWNVANHDVEVIKDGGGSGYVSVILKAFGLPQASDSKRALSNIRLKYRDAQRATIDTTAVAIGIDMQQNVPQVNVSGATNIAGVVRLMVNSTANMATGQKWFVNSVGGLTGINGLSWPVSVFDATHVDLQGSAFAGSYTSGGYLRVPAALRDIHIQAETTLSASQPTAFSTYKENSDNMPDTTVSGYDVENISFSGSLKGYNYGVPAISMFLNNDTSKGTWSGERMRNISLHDLTVTGTNSSVLVDTTGVTNFELKNIYSTATTVPWTVTGSPRVQNVSATGITDRLAVVPSAAASHFFTNGLDATTGQLAYLQPSYSDLLGSIPTGTTFAGSLIGLGSLAPATPALGNGAVWFDPADGQLHVKNSSGAVSTTVIPNTGAANNFLTAIGPGGGIFNARPTCANLSDSGGFCSGTSAASLTGTLAAGQFPALTGDITTSAGSLATTLATAQPAVHTWALAQTFTVAPVFTDQSGSRTALGLGTVATQAASAVAITGGTINGTTIGGSTPAAITGTTIIGNTSVTSPLHYGGSSAGSTATINGTSNGSPSSAYLLLQTNGQNVGIGNAAPKAPLDLNANLSNSPALVVSTSLLRLQAADASAAGGMEFASYGAAPQNILSGMIAGGTAASPTVTPVAKNMLNLRGYGYNGTSFQVGGLITIHSGLQWSGSSRGTAIDFYTTPDSSTTIALAGSFNQKGGLSIGQATDSGAGTLTMVPQLFSALTACAAGTKGAMAYVTDSTTNIWGAMITGSGPSNVLASCNGTNWTVVAK
jgi:hypothetical protein